MSIVKLELKEEQIRLILRALFNAKETLNNSLKIELLKDLHPEFQLQLNNLIEIDKYLQEKLKEVY